MNREIYFIQVVGTATEPEDRGVAGAWAVSIDADTKIERGQIAGAALDEFHDSVAIASLDDFEITVVDADGCALYQDEDYVERSMQHLVDFEGPIHDDDLPPAVAAFDPWK